MNKEEKRLFNQFQALLASAKADPAVFIENFCHLKDQALGKPLPFLLWPCQKEQLDDWVSNPESITLKTRQIGISWLSGAFALWSQVFNPYFESMIISKKEDDAVEYLSRVKFMYDHMPVLVQQINPIINSTRLRLEFKEEGKMTAESSNPQAGRGRTLNLLIFDEAAFMPEARSIDTAATPTLEKTGGKKIIISTANGYDTYFQPKWKAAITNKTAVKAKFIPWDGDPTRDHHWWEHGYHQSREEDKGPEWLQEHPRNWNEAFIVSGQTVFDPNLITELGVELDKRHIKPKKYDFDSKNRIIKEPRGHLSIYEYPNQECRYVIGADVAEGLAKGDQSVAIVYCRNLRDKTYSQVAEYANQIDTDTFARILFRLGKYYNHAIINLEMNAYGESVMNVLQKQLHYPRFYHQMRYDETSKRKVKKLGWKTTLTSKNTLIDTLKAMLKSREMAINSRASLSELQSYIRYDSGYIPAIGSGSVSRMGASFGAYDDRVISQALCAIVLLEKPVIQKRRHAPKYQWNSNRKAYPRKKHMVDPKKVLK